MSSVIIWLQSAVVAMALSMYGTVKQLNAAKKALKARLGLDKPRGGYFGIKASKESGGLFASELSGKLEGMHAFSTSSEICSFCQRMSKVPDSICAACFSRRSIIPELGGYKKGLRKNLIHNTEWLNADHDISDFPVLNDIVCRIQSHGETETVKVAENFCKLCLRNPQTRFTAWCKVPFVWDQAFKQIGKPDNLHMIYSSPMINKAVDIDKIRRFFPWIEKVFTVYSLEYILVNPAMEGEVNCGSRQCLACRVCYSDNDVQYIKEVVK